jgi:hypothetical protein
VNPAIIIKSMAVIAITLTTTNYGYQAATGHDWMAATERSTFQFIAICCCCISMITLTAEEHDV